MTEPKAKKFDCVQTMRRIRNGISAEIEGMSYEELAEWLRAHPHSDPVLRRLAEEAVRRAATTERPASRR